MGWPTTSRIQYKLHSLSLILHLMVIASLLMSCQRGRSQQDNNPEVGDEVTAETAPVTAGAQPSPGLGYGSPPPVTVSDQDAADDHDLAVQVEKLSSSSTGESISEAALPKSADAAAIPAIVSPPEGPLSTAVSESTNGGSVAIESTSSAPVADTTDTSTEAAVENQDTTAVIVPDTLSNDVMGRGTDDPPATSVVIQATEPTPTSDSEFESASSSSEDAAATSTDQSAQTGETQSAPQVAEPSHEGEGQEAAVTTDSTVESEVLVMAPPTVVFPMASPYSSSADTLRIVGECTVGAVVIIMGSSDKTTPCDLQGRFSLEVVATQDGTYTYQVFQEVLSARSDTYAEVVWVHDSIAPIVPVRVLPTSSPYTSSDSSTLLMGRCEARATVFVTQSASTSTECQLDGTFTVTLAGTLDGVYEYSVYQVDAAGNHSGTMSFVWVRDAQLPATPRIFAPAMAEVFTKNSQLAISGSCTTGNAVHLHGEVVASEVVSPVGALVQTCEANAFTFTIQKLLEGSYNLAIDQSNPISGVTSAETSFTWILDTTPPDPPAINQPMLSPYTSSGDLTIAGSCEDNAIVELTGDHSALATCLAERFEFSLVGLQAGSYQLVLQQTDRAGNMSSQRSLQWIKDDAMVPMPNILYPHQSPFYSSGSELTIVGTCLPGLNVALAGDIAAQDVTAPAGSMVLTCASSGTFSFAIAKLRDDRYEFTLTQSDQATVSAATTVVWERDTKAPVVELVAAPPANNTAFAADFAFVSDDPKVQFQCRLGTAAFSICTSPHHLDLTLVGNGLMHFSVRAVDIAGNVSDVIDYSWNQGAYATVALYHFDQSTGYFSDSGPYQGLANLGLIDGASLAAPGKFGEGRGFASGHASRLTVPYDPVMQAWATTMSIEAQVNLTSLPQNGKYYTIAAMSSAEPGDLGWKLRIRRQGNTTRLTFQASLDGQSYASEVISSNCNLAVGTWKHIAAVWSRGSVKFFCNGKSAGSGTIGVAGSTKFFASTAPLHIGMDPTQTQYFDGALDELRISQTIRWNSSFSPPSAPYVVD